MMSDETSLSLSKQEVRALVFVVYGLMISDCFSMSHGESCKALSLWERRRWWGVVENYYLSLDREEVERVWKSELETQDTSLDACKMMQSPFLSPHFHCFYFYFYFLLFFITTLLFLLVSCILSSIISIRSSKGHCIGVSSRRVCWAHHSDCGHYDQVTGSTLLYTDICTIFYQFSTFSTFIFVMF